MEINESKLNRQLQAIDKWRNAKGVGRFIQPPGFGKTYEMLIIINKFHKKNPTIEIMMICNNEASKNNFYTAINAFKGIFDDIIRDKLFIFTKNEILSDTLDRFRNKTYKLLIVDEIHDFIAPESYKIIDKKIFNYEFIAAFTGTDVSKEAKDKLDKYCPIIDYITYDEAIENAWISDFVEYNLGLELDDESRVIYDRYSEYIKESLKAANNDYTLLVAMAKGKYDKVNKVWIDAGSFCEAHAVAKGWKRDLDLTNQYYKNIDAVFSPSSLHQRAERFINYVELRNKLLDESVIKIKTALAAIHLVKPKKTILFNNSIDFIDTLHGILNYNEVVDFDKPFDVLKSKYKQKVQLGSGVSVRVHSRLEKLPLLTEEGFVRTKDGKIKTFGVAAQKTMAIDNISKGKVKIILAVKSLDSAFNVEDLEICIISGGTTNPIQQNQRVGRVLRVSEYKKLAMVINLYFKNTRDEAKLRERQSNASHKITEITDVNQLIWIKN